MNELGKREKRYWSNVLGETKQKIKKGNNGETLYNGQHWSWSVLLPSYCRCWSRGRIQSPRCWVGPSPAMKRCIHQSTRRCYASWSKYSHSRRDWQRQSRLEAWVAARTNPTRSCKCPLSFGNRQCSLQRGRPGRWLGLSRPQHPASQQR